MKLVYGGGAPHTVELYHDNGEPMTCVTAVDLHFDCERATCQLEIMAHGSEATLERIEAEFPEIARLRRENARLKESLDYAMNRLEQNGIEWNNEGSAA
jgi:hypothetical protein